MTYLGYYILIDYDFDGNKVFAIELRDGSWSEFNTLRDAKDFIRFLQPQNW